MSDYLIEFNNISKFFGKVIALKNVTMKLKKGEIMCLLGDNGAGKSTLIKTLAGVHKPDEGEIIVEGNKTVFDGPKEALDMGIATVYQDLAFVSLILISFPTTICSMASNKYVSFTCDISRKLSSIAPL